ncbi:Ig-like domain-containing protein [Thalassolituus sp.]|uniref:Ig-like domain-containing protein n=1 Tax=Thalassolituus sp. TaxID=2030822 RepID=UPI0027D49EB8|nr:Ig-like domain-containing protein [Thalassolituus sp.]MDQ4424937.1 Ig-like domain-containing protein [Thalassolituus sp.]
MDNNPNKKRPGTSAPLKAIAPVIAMAVPFSAPFSASMANASSRLASVSRNGLNKRAVVSQVEQHSRPEAAGAFSAFGGGANARAVSRTVDQDALAFLASNDLLSVGDEKAGYESGDLDNLTGRKHFLSCTKSGAPYYSTAAGFPVLSSLSFFCTSLFGGNWNPGQDNQPPFFKFRPEHEKLEDMTILPGNSGSQLFEVVDKNQSSVGFSVASSNETAVRAEDLSVERLGTGTSDDYRITISNVVGGGGATITVTATDGNGNSRSDTFFIDTGVAAPDPLEMTGGDSAVSFSLLEDAATTSLTLSDFAASTGATGTMTWSASGGTKGTASATGSVSAPTTGASPTSVTYTPNANATGSDTFTVTVNDGSATDSRAVDVFITPVNDAPTLIVPSTQRVSGTGGTQRTVASFATAQPGGGLDEAGQTFTYSAVETLDANNVVSAVSINSSGDLLFTPAADAEGYAYYSITVTDSGGTDDDGVDTSAPVTVTLSIDTLAPELTLVTPVASPTTDHSPEVTYSSNEAGYLSGGGSCGVADAGLKTPGTYTVRLTQTDNSTPLTDGTYSDCTLIVEDTNGNATTLPLGTFVVTSDLTAPTVTSVDVPTNGTYGVGDVLSFTVNTNEAVNVSGSPAINMMIGGTPVKATYSSGTGTQALVFSTTVAAGDLDTDGIEVLSLTLDGGTMADAAGNAMDLTLNGRGPTAGILVDGVAPVVSSVSVPPADTYIVGDVLTFTVTASEALTISGGTPYLELVVGSAARQATLASTSGADMTFTYIIAAGDLDTDGITTGSLVANGASLQDSADNDLNLALGTVDTSGVLVDAVAPEVQSVSIPAAASYIAADTLNFTVSLSEAVTVSGGMPVLSLMVGGVAREAALVSGSGSSDLTFSYTVATGDLDTDGITVSSIDLKGASVVDVSGNLLVTTLNGVADTSGVIVDAVAPTIAAVQAPADGSYSTGDELRVSLTFSEDLVINTAGGTPAISLTVGSAPRDAAYVAAESSASTAVFVYTVQTGDNDSDGIAIGSLNLNGGSIRDSASNPANLSFTAPDTSGVIVDALAPEVSSVDVPADATYGEGESLIFTVNTSEDVTVAGTPELTLTVGSSALSAVYSGGDGTSALTFSATVPAGLLDTDGISVDALNLAGGSLADAAGNPLDLTLNAVAPTSGVLVDSLAPVVSSVGVPAAATYVSGQTLAFIVNADEPMTADTTGGTPSLAITVGSAARSAALSGVSGNAMTFTYTVQSGDSDADGVSVGALALNGGALTDASGNTLNLTLNNVADTSAVLVDAIAPEVQSVSVPAAATYVGGDTLNFTMTLSEAVTVSAGTPVLTLDIGGVTREAALTAGSGTASLTFSYTLVTGDLDTDGISVVGLDLKGANALDSAGNAMVTTLNGVADSSAVQVDAVVPTVTALTANSSGTITEGNAHTFTVTFSENVSLNSAGGTPRLVLDIGGTTRYAMASAPVAANMSFTYTALAGDLDADGLRVTGIEANGGVITDAAGNTADLSSLPTADTSAMTVDAIPPSISAVEVTAPSYAMAGETITITAVASEAVTISGAPSIALDIGGSSVAALYTAGSGSDRIVFAYTVQPGDNDSDGFAIGAISLNGGNMTDAAGNALDLTITSVPDTSANRVDTTAPVVQSISRYNPLAETTASDTLTWRVQLSEAVSGVGADDFSLAGTTAAIAVAQISDSLYQVTASGGDLAALDGTVGLNLAAGVTATDLAGNALPATEPATDETYTVDNTAPAVNIQAPSATLTSSTAITYVVQYTDADSISLSPDDVAVTATGDAAAGTIEVSGSGPVARTVTLSDFTGDGTLAIDIAAGTAEDDAGNASAAPATSDAFTVDTTRPTVTITAPAASPDPFDITVTFSEDVTGFVVTEITATGGSLSEFTGSGTTYTAKVTPDVVGSPVDISIAADVAEDAATNGNEASASVSVDTNNVPTIAISGDEIEGQTLAAQLSDSDGVSGSVTYDWISGTASVGNAETYTLQASDVGNQLSVNAVYTDDAGYAEDVTSALTGVIISIEQNAWNNIGDSVGSPSTPASFDDYRNVGLSGPSDDELNRIMSILNRAVSQQAAITDIDELSELESLVDTIMEGQDDDEDGLPNLVEDDGRTDTDGDGTDDRDDVDADNDGIRDNLEIDALADMTDDDADGIVNLFDFDVDGDGYPELKGLTDDNLDGVIDEFDTLAELIAYFAPATPVTAPVTGSGTGTGTVGAAVVSPVALAPIATTKEAEVDTDGDGLINSQDIDADNDGIADVIEAGLSDNNDDALVDDGTALIDDATDLPDTDADSDARPDFLQLMSNGTDTDLSLSDAFSGTVAGALDQDGDGQLDSSTDVDQDGLMDVVDNAIGAFGSARDFDGDGIPNHLDPDDDNDNISDIEENAELAQFFTGEDADGDGIDDGFDAEINGETFGTDDNGNGVRDDRELPDLDGDGLVDYLDDDADNDGIRDDIDDEIALPVDLAPGATEGDLDGDGVPDDVDPSVNTETDVKVAGKGSMSLAILMLLGGALVLMRRRTRLLVAMPLAILTGHSQAAGDQAMGEKKQDSNFSFATSAGLSKFDTELADTVELTDENSAGFVLGLGYSVSDELAVEASYGLLGKAGVNTGWVDYSSLALNLQYRPEVVSYGKLRGQFKLGMNRLFYDGAKGLNLDKKSTDVLTFAVGVDYTVNTNDAVEFMFTSYAEDAHFYSVGYRHNF